MSAHLPPVPLDVIYVDPSVAGRAAFVSHHARVLRVCVSDGADVGDLDGDVVFVRHRGGDTAAILDRLVGRQRILLLDARTSAALGSERLDDRCEYLLAVPAAAPVVVLAARTAATAASKARQATALLGLVIERDRLDRVATQRGRLLHDLANLTMALSINVDVLVGVAPAGASAGLLTEVQRITRQMVAVHASSRAAARGLLRDPQTFSFGDVVEQATADWLWSHPEAPPLSVTGETDGVIHADRLDLVHLVLALGDLALLGGVPPHVSVTRADGRLTLTHDGSVTRDSLAFAVATRLVAANAGSWAMQGETLVCGIPTPD